MYPWFFCTNWKVHFLSPHLRKAEGLQIGSFFQNATSHICNYPRQSTHFFLCPSVCAPKRVVSPRGDGIGESCVLMQELCTGCPYFFFNWNWRIDQLFFKSHITLFRFPPKFTYFFWHLSEWNFGRIPHRRTWHPRKLPWILLYSLPFGACQGSLSDRSGQETSSRRGDVLHFFLWSGIIIKRYIFRRCKHAYSTRSHIFYFL